LSTEGGRKRRLGYSVRPVIIKPIKALQKKRASILEKEIRETHEGKGKNREISRRENFF